MLACQLGFKKMQVQASFDLLDSVGEKNRQRTGFNKSKFDLVYSDLSISQTSTWQRFDP